MRAAWILRFSPLQMADSVVSLGEPFPYTLPFALGCTKTTVNVATWNVMYTRNTRAKDIELVNAQT